jgi:hypothetical protein
MLLSQKGVSETGFWRPCFFNILVSSKWSVNADLQDHSYKLTCDFQKFVVRAHLR